MKTGMKNKLILICGFFSILFLFTACNKTGTKQLEYNNGIFTEELLNSVKEIVYWYGDEKIEMNEDKLIKEFYSYLSILNLEEMKDSEIEGHQYIDIITDSETISIGILAGEIVINSKTYSTDKDVVKSLTEIAQKVKNKK